MTAFYALLFVGIPVLWLVARQVESAHSRQLLYLAASYLLYLNFGLFSFVILLGSTLFNFYWGGVVRRRPTTGMLWIGILGNIALLSTFKYLPQLMGELPSSLPLVQRVAHLALPIGISFWTFQGLGYLFDQYREERLDPTLIEFMLFMGFAPTVLSGPVCRLPEMLPQFRSSAKASWEDVKVGAHAVWIGVFMITLARFFGGGLDGRGINWAFDHAGIQLSTADVWVMLAGYGFQLFFDFAGYTSVVIGIALMFGIRLPENFRQPFLAATPAAFWQRWHISLSFWIRDYLFMPLATMRREVWWRNGMLVFSMIVFGLWHKGSLLFLLWGTYQGLLLLAHRLLQQWQRRRGVTVSSVAGTFLSWFVTFVLITLGWIMFRAHDGAHAMTLLGLALVPSTSAPMALPVSFAAFVIVAILAYFIVAAIGRRFDQEGAIFRLLPIEVRYACYGGIFYFALFHTADPQSFIYFQF
jgi:alginate O-acetyltransferase complex protein AlgI